MGVQRELVAELVGHLTLDSVQLVAAHAERWSREIPEGVDIRLQELKPRVEQANGRIEIRYAHRARFFPSGDEPESDESPRNRSETPGEHGLGQVEVRHVVTWRSDTATEHDADVLQAFAEADAYFMAYPYVRQALQQQAEQVQLPPLVLPVLGRSVTG